MTARRPFSPFLLLISLLSLLSFSLAPAAPASAPAGAYQVYLPIIHQAGCAPSAQEAALADLIRQHPDQQRPAFACHQILENVARAHAVDMAVRGYVGHVNLEGFGPNYRVQQAGYLLPADYGQDTVSNNIQLLAVGVASAQQAFNAWHASPPHRDHLLGLLSPFDQQVEYGIGYAFVPSSDYVHYWVVITARRGP
jgi:hypothetical protein